MSSFTMTNNEIQPRTQRRLLFEGFNVHEPLGLGMSQQMLTSTPERKPRDQYESKQSIDIQQGSEPCLVQLQNARQLLSSMSRTGAPINNNEQALSDEVLPRPEIFNEGNPELTYYKSSLESERTRRKQLETLIEVQQQRLSEAESELIQLRANDHKKTLCMKQLEQMIPNVVDEWKQKESEYKSKLSNLTQQIKELEQTNRDKILTDKQTHEEQLSEKNLIIDRLNKETERFKQDCETAQTRSKQQEQRIQQLVKDAEQTKQRHSSIETELRNELKQLENRIKDLETDIEKKQHELEQTVRDHQRTTSDHHGKVRQLEHELDEQRRENNVLKMELDLREAKYRAQLESQKIQLIRESESKITQRLEEQHSKHVRIEEELNELHRRKLADVEEKYQQILSGEQQEHENRIQALMNKIEQMKNDFERLQTTTMAERQDLARKLQDVFETTLLKNSARVNLPTNDISPSIPPLSIKHSSSVDTQAKDSLTDRSEFLKPMTINNIEPASMSAIRSLSSRIDSLVDHTNRIANDFEYSSKELFPIQYDNHQSRFLSSRPQSTLPSPYFRSTPIDCDPDWLPASSTTNFPLVNFQQTTSNGFTVDDHLHGTQYRPTTMTTTTSSSLNTNLIDHQQESQPSSNNESLSRYVKMLLERSPSQDSNTKNHPLVKTNQSLHDIRLSLDQLNLAEHDSKTLIDDLAQHVHNESQSPRGLSPRQQKSVMIKQNAGKVKKRLDYENHHAKQTNTNELFERLSQPKTRAKKDKSKPTTQPSSQTTSNGHNNIWK